MLQVNNWILNKRKKLSQKRNGLFHKNKTAKTNGMWKQLNKRSQFKNRSKKVKKNYKNTIVRMIKWNKNSTKKFKKQTMIQRCVAKNNIRKEIWHKKMRFLKISIKKRAFYQKQLRKKLAFFKKGITLHLTQILIKMIQLHWKIISKICKAQFKMLKKMQINCQSMRSLFEIMSLISLRPIKQ